MQGQTKQMTNIMVRAKIKDIIRDNSKIYYGYDLTEGDTPEIIADKYYGDAGLHWVVLMMNTTPDGRWDVGMDYKTFTNFVTEKYPGVTMNTNSFAGDIKVGARIVGITSGAEGVVLGWNASTGRIVLDQIQGSFQKGEQANTTMLDWDGSLLSGQMQFGQYKVATLQATHHYEGRNGLIMDYARWVQEAVEDRREVSNLVYETELNQQKRTVRLLKPIHVGLVVEEMKEFLTK